MLAIEEVVANGCMEWRAKLAVWLRLPWNRGGSRRKIKPWHDRSGTATEIARSTDDPARETTGPIRNPRVQ